jgi:hypothetical protein
LTDTEEVLTTPVASMPKYRWISKSSERENRELRRELDEKVYRRLEEVLDMIEERMKK